MDGSVKDLEKFSTPAITGPPTAGDGGTLVRERRLQGGEGLPQSLQREPALLKLDFDPATGFRLLGPRAVSDCISVVWSPQRVRS